MNPLLFAVIIASLADWVIDLGPEAGDAGGNLVYAGVPSGLKKNKTSYTYSYLITGLTKDTNILIVIYDQNNTKTSSKFLIRV